MITPHAAPGPEVEWPLMTAGRTRTRVARIPAPGATPTAPGTPPTSPSGLRALAAPAALVDAAADLGGPPAVEAIGYASTSTGYVIGAAAETTILADLSERCGVPVTGTSTALGAALRVLEVERLELVHPPWFDEEMNQLGATYVRDQGYDVVASASVGVPGDAEGIDVGEVATWITQHVSEGAQAVFIGGTGFRVAATIEQLERQLGRPVLTANQVLLWSLLGMLDDHVDVTGYGSIFQHAQA